ncbi:hypothetical protein [Phenylobacterium sp.]|uniref:hypothetical protein n=1 Tax=Phenylobacterium sp. TaxID=1871053 RepID=UPI0030F4931B
MIDLSQYNSSTLRDILSQFHQDFDLEEIGVQEGFHRALSLLSDGSRKELVGDLRSVLEACPDEFDLRKFLHKNGMEWMPPTVDMRAELRSVVNLEILHLERDD